MSEQTQPEGRVDYRKFAEWVGLGGPMPDDHALAMHVEIELGNREEVDAVESAVLVEAANALRDRAALRAILTSLRASQAALVEAVEAMFKPLGADGYFPACGKPVSDRVRAALAQSQERAQSLTAQKQEQPAKCIECDSNYADPPSKLCPGCQAYREHQR